MSAEVVQRNQDATCYVGNIDEKTTDEILWELMLQAGNVMNVHMPKDKVTGKHQGYGFVEFRSEDDADYAIKVISMIKLYGKPLKVNKATADKRQTEIGANIFIGNLDPDVDDKLLYDTFSAFGGIEQTPKVMRDEDNGMTSKGFGFVSFSSFESSDLAIECMNGQYLCNRAITVQYAYKKDSQGIRHGTQAERLLAASQPQKFKPHTMFSAGSEDTTTPNVGVSAILGLGGMQQTQPQMGMGYDPSMMQQMQAGYDPNMMGMQMGVYDPIQMQLYQQQQMQMGMVGQQMPMMNAPTQFIPQQIYGQIPGMPPPPPQQPYDMNAMNNMAMYGQLPIQGVPPPPPPMSQPIMTGSIPPPPPIMQPPNQPTGNFLPPPPPPPPM
jgi:splicing factor 3B subunit 4